MIRTPNEPRMPNIKNRSSKHLYNLTRAGIRQMQEMNRRAGVPEYKPTDGLHKKDAKKPETREKAEETK